MKNKIKNWIEEHERVCGLCLLGASLCAVAFGGAYLGSQLSADNITYVVNLVGPDEVITELTAE